MLENVVRKIDKRDIIKYHKVMEINEILEKVGLNQKEASVYLALLELGTSNVHAVANKARIKRPTTYLILDQLRQKGMVSMVPKAKKALYTAESPEFLVGDIRKKEELLKRFMPNLLALYNTKKDKPQVQLFEGKEGIDQVYQKLFASGEVCFFSTVRDVFNVFPDMPRELLQMVKAKKIKVKEILTQGKDDLAFARSFAHDEYYQHRFAKPGTEFITDNAIFGDSVVFFTYSPYFLAVMITSRGISQSLKLLFDMAWQAAEPFEKVITKNPS